MTVADINPKHIGLLEASLRSPSAHNAQPWRIKPLSDGHTYELHYDHNNYLPEDPDDRDAYLTMGAFVETMVLAAPNFGLSANVTTKLTRNGDDLFVAVVDIVERKDSDPVDHLSQWVDKRATNRNKYKKDPLTPELEAELTQLGNVLVTPAALKDVLTEASMMSWANPRFVTDLKAWFRKDPAAPDGFTADLMHLSPVDVIALKLAFKMGSLKSKLLERLYSTRDVAMFTAAPKAAVLAAKSMDPTDVFTAGRNLLRSWVAITAAGYNYHPFSIAIDEKATAPQVAQIADIPVPVALFRIGKATKPPRVHSNRKPLEKVLIP